MNLERATAYADAFNLLAILTQFPTEELYGGVASGGLAQDIEAVMAEAGIAAAEGCPASELGQLSGQCARGEVSLQDIRREYSRLFNQPEETPINLHEGQFIYFSRLKAGTLRNAHERPRTFVNDAALDAERCYRKAGLKRSADMNIPGDCMFTEMAFMGHLYSAKARAMLEGDREAETRADGLIEEFSRIHLDKWMHDFYEECAMQSSCALYRATGWLGKAVYAGVVARS